MKASEQKWTEYIFASLLSNFVLFYARVNKRISDENKPSYLIAYAYTFRVKMSKGSEKCFSSRFD